MPEYFDFEVSLCDVAPRIWRRFLIRKVSTFQDLHRAIQDACGWESYHLFEFRSEPSSREDIVAGIPDDEYGPPAPDARKIKLAAYFAPSGNRRCFYLYDFGDCWEHEVNLKGIIPSEETFKRRLLDGARAFPPEDCGGTWGYERCVKIAQGHLPKNEDDRELKQWLGRWDPEAFDLKAARKSFDR